MTPAEKQIWEALAAVPSTVTPDELRRSSRRGGLTMRRIRAIAAAELTTRGWTAAEVADALGITDTRSAARLAHLGELYRSGWKPRISRRRWRRRNPR